MEKWIFLAFITLSMLISCTDQPNDGLLFEPVGSAHYFIQNQTESDLRVDFTASKELNFETRSILVPSDSSKVIFTDGIIGVNPKPSDSFSSIRIFKAPELTDVLLVMDPIEDNDWTILSRKFDTSGYGLTEYEFTVNNPESSQ